MLLLLLLLAVVAVVAVRMPLIPALGREGQVELCECEASLMYTASSRATQRKSVLEKPDKTKTVNSCVGFLKIKNYVKA